MGACNSAESAKRSKESEEIDKAIREDGKKESQITRLLLLGTGESGKSTLGKQLRLLGKVPFTEDEREMYRDAIQLNLKRCALLLSQAANNASSKSVSKKAKKLLDQISEDWLNDTEWETISRLLRQVWEFDELKRAIRRDSAFTALPDSLIYFFDGLDRFSDPDYVPTDDDIIRVRVKTTGVSETRFQYSGVQFVLVDVGGQRSERRKWLQCFQDVTAIIYAVSLAEYDMMLEEDDNVSRIQETLDVFKMITSSRFLSGIPIMLFLNKRDIFEEKIKIKPLTVAFPKYKGEPGDWKAAADYIKRQLLSVVPQNNEANIYAHVTCAIDPANIKFVFDAVRDSILQSALSVLT